jgi:phosphoglycolate phosphatase-like HAD superfamily hydrolase
MARFVTNVVDVEVHAVGLDVDGVLRNTGFPAYEAFCAAVEELNGTVPTFDRFVAEYVSSHLPFYSACGVSDLDLVHPTFQKHWKHHDNVAPFADVPDFLTHLESLDLRVFVVSSHPTEKLHTWLKEHDLHPHIKEIRGGSRDKEVCLRESCTTLGIQTRSMLYFGDWGLDMRAAQTVGGTAVGVTRGYNSRNALVRSGAHHVIDHLSEAMTFLR